MDEWMDIWMDEQMSGWMDSILSGPVHVYCIVRRIMYVNIGGGMGRILGGGGLRLLLLLLLL